MDILRQTCGLSATTRVADVGSGTGNLTRLFLDNGNPVWAVEPNPEMRAAAETLLGDRPGFTSVAGSAEATTLPDGWVDLVSAGQAFHWFDVRRAPPELRRVLRPGGWVVLVWNRRREDAPFHRACEEALYRHAPEYGQVDHRALDRATLDDLFHPLAFVHETAAYWQSFDLEGVKGRLLSSSYTPKPGHPGHEPLMADLEALFREHARDGQVRYEYRTDIYLACTGSE